MTDNLFTMKTVDAVCAVYPVPSEMEWTRSALIAFCKLHHHFNHSITEIFDDLNAVEGGFSSCWIETLEQSIFNAEITDMEKGFFLGCLRMRNIWELKANRD